MTRWWAWRARPWHAVDYWVLDLETGGFDAKRDPILSLGMVPIRQSVILMGESFYTLMKSDRPVAEASPFVHHVVPAELAGAPHPAQVLDDVDRRLNDAVLVVHYARLDIAFLKTAYGEAGRKWPRVPVIDTMKLLARLNRRRAVHFPGPDVPLSLGEARARLGLPPHHEHHALSDAVATAELFLLLSHRLGARKLRHLL